MADTGGSQEITQSRHGDAAPLSVRYPWSQDRQPFRRSTQARMVMDRLGAWHHEPARASGDREQQANAAGQTGEVYGAAAAALESEGRQGQARRPLRREAHQEAATLILGGLQSCEAEGRFPTYPEAHAGSLAFATGRRSMGGLGAPRNVGACAGNNLWKTQPALSAEGIGGMKPCRNCAILRHDLPETLVKWWAATDSNRRPSRCKRHSLQRFQQLNGNFRGGKP